MRETNLLIEKYQRQNIKLVAHIAAKVSGNA